MIKVVSRIVKITVAFLVICFLLIACTSKSDENMVSTIVFSKFPKNDKISFRNLFEYKMGEPGILLLANDNLITFNVSRGIDHFLNNYSLKNN